MQWRTLAQHLRQNITIRLLLIFLVFVVCGFGAIEISVRALLSRAILSEKQAMLFGLTNQLDSALEGTFDDILAEQGVPLDDREAAINCLNRELTDICDFVASAVPGVGVGYYHRALDAIITYAPSDDFQNTIGRSIFPGHQGYDVMRLGVPMVQEGNLVRGRILNCMTPIVRNGAVIGYIWANQTIDLVASELSAFRRQLLTQLLIIFSLLYGLVVLTTRRIIGQVDLLRDEIQQVIDRPNQRLKEIPGELNIIVNRVNELLASVQLFKSYNHYVLDSVLNGVLALTESGAIALVNPTFGELFAVEPSDVLGRGYSELFQGPLGTMFRDGLARDGDKPPTVFTWNERILESHCSPIRTEGHGRIGVVFVFRDITLVRQYERQLQNNDRMTALGEMGLHLAHEIKNPLTSIKGFSQLIGTRELPEERKKYFLCLIDEELERVNGLLNDMLNYGGRFQLDPEPCDMLAVLRELMIIYRSVYQDINFDMICSMTSCELNIDKNRITQLLDNLIKNAVDSIRESQNSRDPGRGRVEMHLEDRGEEFQLSVIDDGGGISPQDFDRIFSPFFTTKAHGTGLGLSLCVEIMELHGGSISADSQAGGNTQFVLHFVKTHVEVLS